MIEAKSEDLRKNDQALEPVSPLPMVIPQAEESVHIKPEEATPAENISPEGADKA